jgi:Fur family transcriptional regulator, ferric uptake regulator
MALEENLNPQEMALLTTLEQRCLEKGLKMTGQRRVITRVLAQASDHPDVEQVYRRAQAIDANISLATVYRTMKLLEDAQVVERLDFGDGRARYEENRDEHHHHLIDIETGEVVEFQHEALEVLKRRIAAELGFELIAHRLELYGRRVSPSPAQHKPS